MISFSRDADFQLEAYYTNPEVVVDGVRTVASFSIAGVKPAYDGTPQKVKLKVRVNENGCFEVPEATLAEKIPPPPEEEGQKASASPAAEGVAESPRAEDAAAGSAERSDAPAMDTVWSLLA